MWWSLKCLVHCMYYQGSCESFAACIIQQLCPEFHILCLSSAITYMRVCRENSFGRRSARHS